MASRHTLCTSLINHHQLAPPMKKLFFIALITLLSSAAYAQEWGIGLKGGLPSGISVKRYISARNAFDVTLGRNFYNYDYNDRRYRGAFTLTATYQWRQPISGAKGLEFYYGVGGMLSSRRYYAKNRFPEEYEYNAGLAVAGAAGIEYFFSEVPITLLLEITPTIEIFPDPLRTGLGPAIGARFYF
jgi:hypothetical protein